MSHLLLAMLRGILHKDVWEANRAALSDEILTNADVKTLVMYIGELHENTTDDITSDDLRLAIEAKYRRPDGRKTELLSLVEQIHRADDMPFEQVQPHIADFLTREIANAAMVYIGSREDSDRFDIRKPYEMLELALSLSKGIDLGVEDMSEAPEPSSDSDRKGVATVGLGPCMDAHLGGGVGTGEMQIWLAPPAVGKTSLLINEGVEQAKQGEDVLHITLEISGAKCRQRVDQKLTGLTRDERLARPKAVIAARKELTGKYYIKDWCGRNVTVDDIRSLVNNMRAQGKEVTCVSIDYLELMAPTNPNRHGERFNHSQTAKELRRLGNELGVKIITAWQVNRAGADKHVISTTDVSECWDVVKHADIILGLNQGPEELANHVLRVNILKQREGTARPTEYYYSNLDRMIIKERKEGDADGEPEEVGSGDRSGAGQQRGRVTTGL